MSDPRFFDEVVRALSHLQNSTRDSYSQKLLECLHMVVRLVGYDGGVLDRLRIRVSESVAHRMALHQNTLEVALGCGDSVSQKDALHILARQCAEVVELTESPENGDLVRHLVVLVEDVLSLIKDAESHIIAYLAACISYERACNGNGLLEPHSEDTDIESERIRDLILGVEEVSQTNDYKPAVASLDLDLELEFYTGDPQLFRLYQLVVNVALTHSTGIDIRQCARVLWNEYMDVKNVVRFEVLDFAFHERKLTIFNRFFMDPSPSGWRLLPLEYDDISNSVLSAFALLFNDPGTHANGATNGATNGDFEPKLEHVAEASVPPSSGVSTSSMETFSKADRGALFANLRQLIPLLEEFDFAISVDYPAVLKHYLGLVYEEIHELLLLDDYKYVTELVRVVNQIVDFENDNATSEKSIGVLLQELVQLHQTLTQDTHTATIVMRLARTEWSKQMKAKKAHFEKWNRRLLRVCNLDVLCEDKAKRQLNLARARHWLGVWYGKTIRFDRLSLEVKDYYNRRLLLRYFVGRVIGKIERFVDEDEAAVNFQLKRFIGKWKQRVQFISERESQAVSDYETKLKQTYFSIITTKALQAQKTLEVLAEIEAQFALTNHREIQRKIFRLWLVKLAGSVVSNGGHNEDTSLIRQRFKLLATAERQHVLSKFMSIWRLNHSFQIRAFKLNQTRDWHILKYCFCIWLQKSRMISESSEFRRHHDLVYSKEVLRRWKQKKDLRQKARDFNQKQMLRKYFGMWKKAFVYGTEENKLKQNTQHATLVLHFKAWKQRYLLNQFKGRNEQRLWFRLWTSKLHQVRSQLQKAIDIQRLKVSTSVMSIWLAKMDTLRQMQFVSDKYVCQKVFSKMSSKISNLRELEIMARGTGPYDFNLRLTLKCTFNLWRDRYSDRFNRTAEAKISRFHNEYVTPNSMRQLFRLWVDKYNHTMQRRTQLDHICNNYLPSHPIRRDYFEKWLSLMTVKVELKEKAIEFERTVLLKKYLLTYYDKFMRKLAYLDDIAENYVAQRDHQKSAELLRNWSMKYIMRIQRNNESCRLFIERWNLSRVKSILELWLYKTREVLDDGSPYEFDPNASILSNLSPLSKKYYDSKAARNTSTTSNNGGFLFTPLKQHSPKINTPSNSQETSPSKLQETAQRLKAEKITRLRQRYRNAMASSSSPNRSESIFNVQSLTPRKKAPLQSNSDLTSQLTRETSNDVLYGLDLSTNFIRLSPPKVNRRVSSTVIYGTLSGSESPPSPQKTKQEKEAQKLKRITPITFPLNDDLGSPRFSPLAKLNNRHPQQRKESISEGTE